MHEQVAKSLLYPLAGGSTCMSVRLLGMYPVVWLRLIQTIDPKNMMPLVIHFDKELLFCMTILNPFISFIN